jgi:hypothetical protein
MSRGVLVLLLVLGLAGCSTRSVVVQPEEVPKLNDSQWTIQSEPAARPR